MLRTDYRFTLTRDTDTFEVTPGNFFAGSFKYEQAEGQLFFRRKFNGELIFKGSDYTYIKGRYDLGYYCDIYELLIEKKVLGVFQVDWTGYFSMTDGSFDFEKCQFIVSPTVEDKYSCIIDNYNTQYNALEQEKSTVISYINSSIEYIVIPKSSGSFKNIGDVLIEGSDPGEGANVKEFQCVYRSPSTFDIGSFNVYLYVFAREVVLLTDGVTPTGSNWLNASTSAFELLDYAVWGVDFGNSEFTSGYIVNYLEPDDRIKWARRIGSIISLPLSTDISLSLSDSTNILFNKYIEKYKSSYWTELTEVYLSVKKSYFNNVLFSQKISYTNSIELINTIHFLLEKTCGDLTIISDFLNNSTNPVTLTASKTNNIRLVQKSDIKKPQASQPASKGEMSLKDLLELLYVLFQLWWYIDNNDNLVIHQSEIENNPGLNITVSPYLAMTAHKKAIDFNKSLLYRYETWNVVDSNNEDFIGIPIEYPEQCTIKDNDNKTKSYNTSIFSTDLAFIQIGFDKVSDTGFCIVACDASNEVILEVGKISNMTQLNGHLSTANLHDKYWRHNRILRTGKMNGVDTTFDSVQKIRNLQEQQIVYCDEFNPLEQVVTELGNATVNEATQFPLDNKLILNLSI